MLKRYSYYFKVRLEYKYEKYLFFFTRCKSVTYYYQIIQFDRKTGATSMVHETNNKFYHLSQIELYRRKSEEMEFLDGSCCM